jgi:thiamine pyrophosphate-dependent acetolactate synthase large subunit-like protein
VEERVSIMDQMVDVMTEWGVDTVFGMVGHSNLGLAEAPQQAEEDGRLRYFGIRHEGAAAFAASGYAMLTGRPAACFAIAGPGATNLLTGLWDAKVDRVPILALTGQVNTQVLGPGAFQEIPTAAAFEAVSEPVWGEIGVTCRLLSDRLTARDRPEVRQDVADCKTRWRTEKARRGELADPQGRMHPARLFEVLSRVVPEDVVMPVDVGNNTYS